MQVQRMPKFAAGEPDAITGIFISFKRQARALVTVPGKFSKPESAYSISTIYAVKFFTRDRHASWLVQAPPPTASNPARALPVPRPALNFHLHRQKLPAPRPRQPAALPPPSACD